MEENTTNSNATTNTNTAAAAETAVDSIKKLMESVGNDDVLKQKLADALAVLTGKGAETEDKAEKPQLEMEDGNNPADEEAPEDADDDEDYEDEDDDDDDDDDDVSSGSDFSDIFNGDSVAGMVVGFVAGAAVVGGGVLLHKLITKD